MVVVIDSKVMAPSLSLLIDTLQVLMLHQRPSSLQGHVSASGDDQNEILCLYQPFNTEGRV